MTTYLIWEPGQGEDVGCADEVIGICPSSVAEEYAAKNHARQDYFNEASYVVLDTDSGELHAVEINVVPVPEFEASLCKPSRKDVGDLVVRGLILAAGGECDV